MHDDSYKIRYKALKIAASESTNENHCTLLHNHGEFEILCVEKGEADFCVAGENFRAKEKDLILVNPDEVHSVEFDKSKPYLHRCVCFDLKLIPDKPTADGFLKGTLKADSLICDNNELTALFERIFTCTEQNCKSAELEIIGCLSLFFAKLMKDNHIKGVSGSRDTDFTKKVSEFINENLTEQISSKDASRHFNYNHSYFCRAFKKNFGLSFSEFLLISRISHAKIILDTKDISVEQAARNSGFNSSDYFGRCFKKYVGVSPSVYKKSQ